MNSLGRVRAAINLKKPDSGFILGSGCALAPNVPAENIHALV
jgi:uroporphyrinogen-III decarboxylase